MIKKICFLTWVCSESKIDFSAPKEMTLSYMNSDVCTHSGDGEGKQFSCYTRKKDPLMKIIVSCLLVETMRKGRLQRLAHSAYSW